MVRMRRPLFRQALVEPFDDFWQFIPKFSQCFTSMTDAVFFCHGQLGEGLVKLFKIEERIIAESARTALFFEDDAAAGSFIG